MFAKLRSHFGIPGVIAVCALVFAMLGGAYAANNSGQGATASAKGKPGPRGKQGKPGPAGPVGPVGPAGAKGDTGATGNQGSPGKAGEEGPEGPPGKGVIVTELVAGAQEACEETGGALVEKEGSPPGVPVCNGEEGPEGQPGKEGSPWTAGGTLPAGATETGPWDFTADSVNGSKIVSSISFPVQLAAGLTAAHVHFQGLPTEEAFEEACPGGAFGTGAPTAKPGELCVYNNLEFEADALSNATFTSITRPTGIDPLSVGTGKTGALLRFAFSGSAGESAQGFGSWAVTGCGSVATPCP